MTIPICVTEIAGLAANIATAAGVPIALAIFLCDRKRERREREITAYLAINDRYRSFLENCLNDHQLATVLSDEATEPERKQEVHMNYVVSMPETAFFMYRGQDSNFRKKQWTGWNHYMRQWCSHPEFRKRYPKLINTFDDDFCEHIKKIYEDENQDQH